MRPPVAITVDSPPAREMDPEASPQQPAQAPPRQPSKAPKRPARISARSRAEPRRATAPVPTAAPEQAWRGPAAAAVVAALTIYLSFNAGGFFPDSAATAVLAISALLAVALIVVRRPLAGLGPGLGVPLGLLAGFAAWTLASALWSGLDWRALVEADRALLYVLAFALCGILAIGERRLAWGLRGLAVAVVVVCAIGWTTRVAADVWPIAANIHPERLSFPLTYWNSLGLLATLGLLACLYLTSGGRESRAWRVAGAAAIPLLASTLLLTFSRGSLAIALLGLVVYALLSRPRRLLPALAAVAIPTAVALVASYQASLVSSARFASPEGVSEGHELALVVLACAAVAALLRLLLTRADDALDDWAPPRPQRRTVVAAIAGAALVCVALLALFQVPAKVGNQYDSFVEGNVVNSSADARSRLSAGGNNGRIAEWEVALDAFGEQPLHGKGAGSYQFEWDRNRTESFAVVDAHSLYLEVLGELGVVGLVLLGGALVAILVGLARRLGGPERQAYAALIALLAAWAVHAGIDWDWEMPAVTLWLFALAGLGLARAPAAESEATSAERPKARLAARLLGVLCLAALALAPAAILLSQSRFETAQAAFEGSDCEAAISAANSSLDVVGFRPEPELLLGYCHARLGQNPEAAAAMEAAVEREPDNWRGHYGLALVLAIDERDPMPELREAQRLNPFEQKVAKLIRAMRGGGPEQWRAQAQAAALAI